MDTVLEEIFVEGLTDPLPQSPSVSSFPRCQIVIVRVSSPLMTWYFPMLHVMEDTDNELLCQYYDHPVLLQVQQPEILSFPSFSANNGNTSTWVTRQGPWICCRVAVCSKHPTWVTNLLLELWHYACFMCSHCFSHVQNEYFLKQHIEAP
jgi:hypothetical protein